MSDGKQTPSTSKVKGRAQPQGKREGGGGAGGKREQQRQVQVASAAAGIFILLCFLHDRIRNPACKDPCTSQGLQGRALRGS